jgi:hypothetical protein
MMQDSDKAIRFPIFCIKSTGIKIPWKKNMLDEIMCPQRSGPYLVYRCKKSPVTDTWKSMCAPRVDPAPFSLGFF